MAKRLQLAVVDAAQVADRDGVVLAFNTGLTCWQGFNGHACTLQSALNVGSPFVRVFSHGQTLSK